MYKELWLLVIEAFLQVCVKILWCGLFRTEALCVSGTGRCIVV